MPLVGRQILEQLFQLLDLVVRRRDSRPHRMRRSLPILRLEMLDLDDLVRCACEKMRCTAIPPQTIEI